MRIQKKDRISYAFLYTISAPLSLGREQAHRVGLIKIKSKRGDDNGTHMPVQMLAATSNLTMGITLRSQLCAQQEDTYTRFRGIATRRASVTMLRSSKRKMRRGDRASNRSYEGEVLCVPRYDVSIVGSVYQARVSKRETKGMLHTHMKT